MLKRFHGVLPSAAKELGAGLRSYSRLSIKVILEGGSVMDYKIEKLDSLKLLGKVEKQIIGNVEANLFWKRCHEDGTLTTLTEYSTSPDKERIGIADGSSYDGESYLYYIVTPYDRDIVPDGYIIKEILERTYVKFRCVSFNAANTADDELWRKIYSEFFPTSEYEPTEYQLEVYPYADGSYPDDVAEVWITVRKKEG
jgi:predicted transcriptional regulator YdeE